MAVGKPITVVQQARFKAMPTPQLLNDVISLLLLLAPSAALLSLVLAGIALRHDGTAAFAIGGNFTKWRSEEVV